MKGKHMMLSLLIFGSKQPGSDIDLYLAPSIKDFKQMWETGVEMYDGFRNESFMRHLDVPLMKNLIN